VGGIAVPLLRGEGGPTTSALAAHHASNGLSSRAAGQVAKTGEPVSFTTDKLATLQGVSKSEAAGLAPRIESSGSVSLTVAKGAVNATLAKLSTLALRADGFVLSTRAHEASKASTSFSSATIVLQVPQHAFASVVARVQGVGHATSVVTSSNDVTSQYVDFVARLHALDASRAQYLAIMARATTISGILAVQGQLNAIESQIEQLQGQINVLDNATTYGTITVRLAEVGQHAHVAGHRSGLAQAWHDSVAGFVHGVEWLIRIAGPALFALLLLAVLASLGRLAWRSSRRRL
jgi:hypothetical protein